MIVHKSWKLARFQRPLVEIFPSDRSLQWVILERASLLPRVFVKKAGTTGSYNRDDDGGGSENVGKKNEFAFFQT